MISLSFSDALAVSVTTASLMLVSGVVSIAKTALLRVVTLILGPAERDSSAFGHFGNAPYTRFHARFGAPPRPGLLSGGRGSPRPALLCRPAGPPGDRAARLPPGPARPVVRSSGRRPRAPGGGARSGAPPTAALRAPRRRHRADAPRARGAVRAVGRGG